MKIVEIEIGKIKPYDQNPRYNDQAVDIVAKSIEEFGFINPIQITKDYVIVCGHTRHKAAHKLGLTKVPCTFVDYLSEEKITAYRIADNRLAEIATWDYELLIPEIESLQDSGIDLSLLDFTMVDLSEPIEDDEPAEGKTDTRTLPEMDKEIKSEYGKKYKLGKNILFCGSVEKESNIDSLLDGVEVNMLFADWRYAKNNDDLFIKLDSNLLSGSKYFHKDMSFYTFFPERETASFYYTFSGNGMDILQRLYWVKNSPTHDTLDYHAKTESFFFGKMKNGSLTWYGKNQNSNLLHYKNPKQKKRNLISIPVELITKLLNNSTKRGDIVYNVFGGNGECVLACEQVGRICYSVEEDRKYCDIIRKRWAEFVHGADCDWSSLTPEV